MCTPWTVSKLLSCRPCFSQYDPPSGAESESVSSAVATEASNRSMLNRREPFNATSSPMTEKGLLNNNRKYELHWHHGFEDEHYIVLCFGEEESVDQEEDDSHGLEALDKSGNAFQGLNTDSLEDEEEESSFGSTQTESHGKGDEHIESSSTGSRYSNQSDGSNGHGSMGSFSFPVLHKEWIGSPVQMPRPEDFYSRKNSGIHVRFQCCKF